MIPGKTIHKLRRRRSKAISGESPNGIMQSQLQAIENFRRAIISDGLCPPDYIEPGKTYRFPGIGKDQSNTAGWCKLAADCLSGGYGDYSSDIKKRWPANSGRSKSIPGNQPHAHINKKAKKAAEDARLKEQEEAALKASELWVSAQPADPSHEYLVKKEFHSSWMRQADGKLLLPLSDESGKIWALQTIDEDGNKFFYPKGCRTKGLSLKLKGKLAGRTPVCIVEGLATGIAISESTGYPVAVTFSANNLEPAVKAIKEKYPKFEFIFCADDDRKEDRKGNPGIDAAKKAALSLGGKFAVPDMGKKADFWDLWHEQGPEHVKAAIDGAKTVDLENIEPEEDRELIIQGLAKLSTIEYESKRTEMASRLGIRVAGLDKAVEKLRQNKDDSSEHPFGEVIPWADPVDPKELLDEIYSIIEKFIVCSPEIAIAGTLWVAMTWVCDALHVTPIIYITSPEKRCGKSQLLALLSRMSARPIMAGNISPSAVFRSIELWRPTLFIDEADTFIKMNEEIRGILNSGNSRDLAYVIRTVGENFTPKQFSTWGPKAIAGIGRIHDTLMDRSIVLELRRKLPGESVEKLRHANADMFDILQAKLARFSQDFVEEIKGIRTELPEELNDRAQDNWEPLLAIATLAGQKWSAKARTAALTLSGDQASATSTGTELLADIKAVFLEKQLPAISTADLISGLCKDDEKSWDTYNRGNPINAKQVARILNLYGIASKTIRISSGRTAKGYRAESFTEAFKRYLPPTQK